MIPLNPTKFHRSLLAIAWRPLLQNAQWVIGNASTSINRVFVSLFFPEHFTWQCVLRSCIASLLTVGLCMVTMASVMGMGRLAYEFQASAGVFGQRIEATVFSFFPSEYLFWVLLVPLVMNLLADYLALYKTRKLMAWIEKDQSTVKTCAALFIDQVGTYLCFFTGLFVASVLLVVGLLVGSIVGEGFQGIEGPIRSTSSHVLHLVAAMNQPVVMIPCVVSTFFSSIWLWLYGLSIILPRLSQLGNWLGYRFRIRPT